MRENLPLSWFHRSVESPVFNWIGLPLSGVPWIYGADTPGLSIGELYEQLNEEFPDGFLLRGCSARVASYFKERGHEIIRTGAEGIVDLDKLDAVSKSVIDLVDRGSKRGVVHELSLTQNNCKRVSEFIDQTPYGSKTRLEYLFNRTFDSSTRCFVVCSPTETWLGVITVSISSDDSCHTEMILRKKDSPAGVMELLLYSAMNIYKQEGYKYFSLGEVPFVTPKGMEEVEIEKSIKQSAQQYIVFKTGHLIRYAFNYQGLFDFKNKFNPLWKPVYICSAPKLRFRALADMFYETGYLELSFSELLPAVRSLLLMENYMGPDKG